MLSRTEVFAYVELEKVHVYQDNSINNTSYEQNTV